MTLELRLAAQRLSVPAADARDAARVVVGVQAQDMRAAGLALRSRVPGLERRDLAGLVRTWSVRGTLHLLDPADRPWLHALTAAGNLRRFERWLEKRGGLESARRLRGRLDERPRTRAELLPPELSGPVVNVVLPWLAAQGLLLGLPDGRWHGAEPPPPVEREEALATLGRRYAAGYGSTDPADLAAWSGLGLGVARRALGAAGEPPADPPPVPPALLLAAFDTLLLGYRSRAAVVAAAHASRVLPGGGMLRAVVLVRGRAAGTWSAAGGRVSIEWFGRPGPARALAPEIADVERFLSSPGDVEPIHLHDVQAEQGSPAGQDGPA